MEVHLSRCLLLTAVAFTLAACQTTGSGGSVAGGNPFVTQGPLDKSYHLFFSPADHVDELLAAGEVEKASQVWSHQSAYFSGNERAAALKATRTLDAALSAHLAPRLDRQRERLEAIAWPVPRPNWPAIRSVIADADALKAELEGHKVLLADGAPDERHRRFLAKLDATAAKIRAGAKASFRHDDETFFSAYPVPLEPMAVLTEVREAWSAGLANATPAAIVAFRDRYEKALDENGFEALGRLHYRASLAGVQGRGIDAITAALAATRSAKLPLRGVTEDRLAVIEIAQRRSTGEAPATFPVGAATDPPFAIETASLENALDRKADFLLLVDGGPAWSERRVTGREMVQSEYQKNVRHDDNPQFIIARADLRRAEREYRDISRRADHAEARCGGGVGCIGVGLVAGLSTWQAEAEVAAARARLESTPARIPVPTYAPYSFANASVDVTRSGTLGYYLIDRANRVLGQGTIVLSEAKQLVVAEGLHDHDRYRVLHAVRTDGEDKVVAFETRPMEVQLSTILAELSSPKTDWRPLPTVADIRKDILADRAKALSAARSAPTQTRSVSIRGR